MFKNDFHNISFDFVEQYNLCIAYLPGQLTQHVFIIAYCHRPLCFICSKPHVVSCVDPVNVITFT